MRSILHVLSSAVPCQLAEHSATPETDRCRGTGNAPWVRGCALRKWPHFLSIIHANGGGLERLTRDLQRNRPLVFAVVRCARPIGPVRRHIGGGPSLVNCS